MTTWKKINMKLLLNILLAPFGLESSTAPRNSRPVLLGAVEPTLSNFIRKPAGAPKKIWRRQFITWGAQ